MGRLRLVVQQAECGIPVLLAAGALRNTVYTRAAVALAIALHLGIMMAPLPHSIADFGALSLSRLFWVMPEAGAAVLAEVADGTAAKVPC